MTSPRNPTLPRKRESKFGRTTNKGLLVSGIQPTVDTDLSFWCKHLHSLESEILSTQFRIQNCPTSCWCIPSRIATEMTTTPLPPFSARNRREKNWIVEDFPATARNGLLHVLSEAVKKNFLRDWLVVAKELKGVARLAPQTMTKPRFKA